MNKISSSSTSTLLLLLAGLLQTAISEREFKNTCGACWCIPSGDTCPEFSVGHSDTIPTVVSDAYKSFKLDAANSDVFTLKSSAGGACFPFAHLSGNIDKKTYPMASNPQCEFPSKSDAAGAVCAYTYPAGLVGDEASCTGRSYTMKTFDSSVEAELAGAKIVHSGACGVCSNAKDLGNWISTAATMDEESKICGVVWFTNVFTIKNDASAEFNKLVTCFEDAGFQNQCAMMWAHSTATSVHSCKSECVTNQPQEGVALNAAAPTCALHGCIACNDRTQKEQRDKLRGVTNFNTGLTSTISRSCEEYYPIEHWPCDGFYSDVTNPPTPTPVGSGSEKLQTLDRITYLAGSAMLAFAW